MNKRTLLFSSIALGSVVLGIALWGKGKDTGTLPVQAVPPIHLLRAEGRVATYPGSDVIVGTDLGGTLTQVLVQEGDRVRRGQLLALLDARQDGAALREAQSKIRELQADEHYQTTELQRHETLQSSGIISRQALDQTRTQLDLARARREAAQATAERLKIMVSKLRIEAPMDGVVIARFAHGGETVTPGTRLVQIAKTDQVRLEAEIDEFDLSRVHIGDRVKVRAEGYPSNWTGSVEEIPDQVVGRKLKPQDPARPSDTRVLMVKVALKESTPLKLGQRVELEIQPFGTR
jgi:RND family efflux transporter MFP subunit